MDYIFKTKFLKILRSSNEDMLSELFFFDNFKHIFHKQFSY
jgi:hypothetical protein